MRARKVHLDVALEALLQAGKEDLALTRLESIHHRRD